MVVMFGAAALLRPLTEHRMMEQKEKYAASDMYTNNLFLYTVETVPLIEWSLLGCRTCAQRKMNTLRRHWLRLPSTAPKAFEWNMFCCCHCDTLSAVGNFVDRIVGKQLSRYQQSPSRSAGMPLLGICWFMCNVNYACKLFLGPFCLSAIPDRPCWWRPILLSTTPNVACTIAQTHTDTIIMHLFVVCRWVCDLCLCLCLGRASSIFPDAIRYSRFSCDMMKCDSYAH